MYMCLPPQALGAHLRVTAEFLCIYDGLVECDTFSIVCNSLHVVHSLFYNLVIVIFFSFLEHGEG